MGWRLRKSINLGFGFKINLSKSGIGYSWGFPGYRTTKLAKVVQDRLILFQELAFRMLRNRVEGKIIIQNIPKNQN